MHVLQDLVARHKQGSPCGVTSMRLVMVVPSSLHV